MLKRFGRKQPANGKEAPAPEQAKAGGHGDHWGCIFTQVKQSNLVELIMDTARTARPEQAGSEVTARHSDGERVRLCVLTRRNSIETAYPEGVNGPIWPVEVSEVVPWANGIEAQIKGHCRAAAVRFFDTRFYANGHKYRAGETYNFHMSAFAYRVGAAEELEAEGDSGVKVSFKGARAYMPASISNEAADIDDYWFHSPLNGEMESESFGGQSLCIFSIGMAVPDDFEMQVQLFAADHALLPGALDCKPGDDVDGFLWLQGYLAED